MPCVYCGEETPAGASLEMHWHGCASASAQTLCHCDRCNPDAINTPATADVARAITAANNALSSISVAEWIRKTWGIESDESTLETLQRTERALSLIAKQRDDLQRTVERLEGWFSEYAEATKALGIPFDSASGTARAVATLSSRARTAEQEVKRLLSFVASQRSLSAEARDAAVDALAHICDHDDGVVPFIGVRRR